MFAAQATVAQKNSGLDINVTQSKTREKDKVNACAPVIVIENFDNESDGGVYSSIKQEDIIPDDGPEDDIQVTKEPLLGRDMG